jgi:SAM-dependent methyltransferase
MNPVFYKGRLSPPMKMLSYANCGISWATGKGRDTKLLSNNMNMAYEGAFGEVGQYDDYADHYEKVARQLLEGIDVEGKEALDVGCGTGICSLEMLKGGAARVVGVDFSGLMLDKCRMKARSQGYDENMMETRQSPAQSLPFPDNSFDVVASSMVLGLVADQEAVLAEMYRVARAGGVIAISTHGTDDYYEYCEAGYRALAATPSLWLMSLSRVAYWPCNESDVTDMFSSIGLNGIKTRRETWQTKFDTPKAAFDFCSITSANHALALCRNDQERSQFTKALERYFERKNFTSLTQDVIFAQGYKG